MVEPQSKAQVLSLLYPRALDSGEGQKAGRQVLPSLLYARDFPSGEQVSSPGAPNHILDEQEFPPLC